MTTIHQQDEMDDDTVLERLRRMCADRVAAPAAAHDDGQLHVLRDTALARGLPLPSSCPLDAA